MEFLQLFFILLFGHWVGDFVLQSHWMSQNKSKDNSALLSHTTVYTLTQMVFFAIGSVILISEPFHFGYVVAAFGVITFVTHGLTDYFTSRVTSRRWASQQYHSFFVMVGFDQLVHAYTLILTMLWCLGGLY